MGRADPSRDDASLGSEPLRDGLKHNPFAKLRAAGSPAAPHPAQPAPDVGSPVDRPAPRKKAEKLVPKGERTTVPAHARIVVRRERKGHGGKAVTIAEGAGLAEHDVAALARETAKALGTGARVEDGALVVQGEQTERLVAWLAARGFTSVVRGN